MILFDYSQIVTAATHVQVAMGQFSEESIRGHILSSIAMYNAKYKKDFGELWICMDGRYNWRKEYFPYYKQRRRQKRKEQNEKSAVDWNEIYSILEKIRLEFVETLPYKFIKCERAEADDVIATLVKYSQTIQQYTVDNELDKYFRVEQYNPVLIISGDKDFKSLQKFDYVTQLDPISKKFIKCDDPDGYLEELIIKGDSCDDVPNILSPDDVFVNGGRQTPLSKKKKREFAEMREDGDAWMGTQIGTRYFRNKKLIDLTEIPKDIEELIVEEIEKPVQGNMKKVFNYFMVNGLQLHLENIENFKPKEFVL